MEEVLQGIHKRCLTLNDEDIQKSKNILDFVVDRIIASMKSVDPLFDILFTEIFYGGSYYDKLKIQMPDEFDLDLLLDIGRLKIDGKRYDLSILECDSPGFVQLQCDLPYIAPHRGDLARFRNWFDSNLFLSNKKIRYWMEGLVQKSVDRLEMPGQLTVRLSKGGPASTVIVRDEWNEKIMSIDFVPCFVFDNGKWPDEFRPNPFPNFATKSTFFVVPKEPSYSINWSPERFWRLSFQKQERLLIKNKGYLNSSIKFLKLLKKNFSAEYYVASYYIKTVLLHMVEDYPSLWNKSLSEVFMTVLEVFKNYLATKCIPYYWDERLNLIEAVHQDTLKNLSNRIDHMIKQVRRNPKFLVDYLDCSSSNNESDDESDFEPEVTSFEQRNEPSSCNIL